MSTVTSQVHTLDTAMIDREATNIGVDARALESYYEWHLPAVICRAPQLPTGPGRHLQGPTITCRARPSPTGPDHYLQGPAVTYRARPSLAGPGRHLQGPTITCRARPSPAVTGRNLEHPTSLETCRARQSVPGSGLDGRQDARPSRASSHALPSVPSAPEDGRTGRLGSLSMGRGVAAPGGPEGRPNDPEIVIADLKRRPKAQERQVGEFKQEKEEWEAKYSKKQDAEAIGRAEIQHLNKTAEANATKKTTLSQELETVMKDTLVLIFAAVVMKVMYKRAADIPQQDQNAGGQDGCVKRIRGLRSRLLQLGYENAGQVVGFTNELRQSSPHQDDGGDHLAKNRASPVKSGDVVFSLV
ncbi:hypothetical protein HOY80DRAFT_1033705 [Tuber brumale]|nr:hypothetical protein HOY80DRAFT_1033705 [Tuber brumale]